MKNKITFSIYTLLLVLPMILKGQDNLIVCNSFDTTVVYITPMGSWEIGEPTKTVFDSSYSGANSIVTDLDTLYTTNDTSVFYAVFKWEGDFELPNYLGTYAPFEIEFNHRFLTDSITDYGKIEMSLNGGTIWYDVLSNDYAWDEEAYTEHFFEGTGETLYDSLSIFGDSQGWVHSRVAKNVENMISSEPGASYYPDSIILKFSFITDSIGHNEGWQIDDLCMRMIWTLETSEKEKDVKKVAVYPNPNNGVFSVVGNEQIDELSIYNMMGDKVYTEYLPKETIRTALPQGIYILSIRQNNRIETKKILIE